MLIRQILLILLFDAISCHYAFVVFDIICLRRCLPFFAIMPLYAYAAVDIIILLIAD